MGAPRAIALCKCFSGALEYQAGNWEEAETVLAESIKLYRELGAASGEALAWQRLGVIQTARGQFEEAMDSFREGLEVADRAMMRAHCQIRLFASMIRNRLLAGDLKTAEEYFKLGLEMSVRHGNCVTCDALFLPAVVSLQLAKGNIQEAEEYCQKLESAVDKYGSSMWVAMANQSRGEVLAAQGLLEDALEKYDKAYKIYQQVGHNYEAARCLSAIADLLDTKDASVEDEQAVIIREQAQTIFERLGAVYPV
ncbi:MAG: tetratricopeptide repeat protein [Anaerolineales bacterium]|nr:tetratricopeptide repeat protein [Anaerolineales bacterium]